MLTMPIFPGDSGVDQIVEIIKILGTPSRDDIRAMNPNYNEFRFPQINAIPWEKVFKPQTNPDAIKFVSSLLVYNPQSRPNPLVALQSLYFDEIRDSATRLSNGQSIPTSMFDFTKEEMKYAEKIGQPNLIDTLVPEWYKSIARKKLEKQRRMEQQKALLDNIVNSDINAEDNQAYQIGPRTSGKQQ